MALNTTSEVALFFMSRNKPPETHHDSSLPSHTKPKQLSNTNAIATTHHVTFSDPKLKKIHEHSSSHHHKEEEIDSDDESSDIEDEEDSDNDEVVSKNIHKQHEETKPKPKENEQHQHLILKIQELEIKLSNLDAEWNTRLQSFKKEESELTKAQITSLSKENDQKLSDAIKSMTSKIHETKHLANQMKDAHEKLNLNHNRLEHAFEDLLQDLKEESATNDEHFQHLEVNIQQIQKQIQQQQPKQPHSLKERPPPQPTNQHTAKSSSSTTNHTPFHFSFPLFSSSSNNITTSKDKEIENDTKTDESSVIRNSRDTNPKPLRISSNEQQQKHPNDVTIVDKRKSKQQIMRSMSPSPIPKVTPQQKKKIPGSVSPTPSEHELGPARGTRSQVQKRNATTADDMSDALLAMVEKNMNEGIETNTPLNYTEIEERDGSAETKDIFVDNDENGQSTNEWDNNHNRMMMMMKNQNRGDTSLLLEPCSDQSEGFHQLLMYIIQHLQSKTVQSHAELDEVVIALSDVAVLQYPTEAMITVVSDRQASILRLISSFYQIVCLISMDEKLTPEEVYANKELMLQASHRVLAMHS